MFLFEKSTLDGFRDGTRVAIQPTRPAEITYFQRVCGRQVEIVLPRDQAGYWLADQEWEEIAQDLHSWKSDLTYSCDVQEATSDPSAGWERKIVPH